MSDPTVSPSFGASPAPPPVLVWQRVYCFAMAAVYVLLALVGVVMAIFRHRFVDAETTPTEVLVVGLAFLVGGAAFAAPYLAAPFLPRRGWVWILHLVLIAIGLTSCACLPFAIPLMVFWIRPETQAWFAS